VLHTVPGGHPNGTFPQHVLPTGAEVGRQHGPVGPFAHLETLLTHAIGPQHVTVAGDPGAQNGWRVLRPVQEAGAALLKRGRGTRGCGVVESVNG
jgi:hypothetical protein